MNKTRNKGFTLVELLAVIVILAVVILIAVTAVVPRMNIAKKKAFVDEALVYYKAAKEAYVTDPSTECYNIADMSNLVKQSKNGYSGTVYVNEHEISINLTNGKYYIKTNITPEEMDIEEEKPNNFVSSCSEVKQYNIEYDIPSDATVTNPSTYKTNDGTLTLNNPTRPGYKFVGWSSKNLFNLDARETVPSSTEISQTTARTFENYTLIKGMSFNNYYYVGNVISVGKSKNRLELKAKGGYGYGYAIPSDASKIYTVSFKNKKTADSILVIGGSYFDASGSYITYSNMYPNDGSRSKKFTTPANTKTFMMSICGANDSGVSIIKDIQLEEGSNTTDYQEYMDPTTNAKIYRGSTGNKKFIANWEAI